jgi:hypothetical protein
MACKALLAYQLAQIHEPISPGGRGGCLPRGEEDFSLHRFVFNALPWEAVHGLAKGAVPQLSGHSKRNFQNPRLKAAQFKRQRFFQSLALCPFGYAVRSKGCSGIALMHALAGHPLFQHLFIQSRNRFLFFWLPVDKD